MAITLSTFSLYTSITHTTPATLLYLSTRFRHLETKYLQTNIQRQQRNPTGTTRKNSFLHMYVYVIQMWNDPTAIKTLVIRLILSFRLQYRCSRDGGKTSSTWWINTTLWGHIIAIPFLELLQHLWLYSRRLLTSAILLDKSHLRFWRQRLDKPEKKTNENIKSIKESIYGKLGNKLWVIAIKERIKLPIRVNRESRKQLYLRFAGWYLHHRWILENHILKNWVCFLDNQKWNWSQWRAEVGRGGRKGAWHPPWHLYWRWASS